MGFLGSFCLTRILKSLGKPEAAQGPLQPGNEQGASRARQGFRNPHTRDRNQIGGRVCWHMLKNGRGQVLIPKPEFS